jgi:hypothetical protein
MWVEYIHLNRWQGVLSDLRESLQVRYTNFSTHLTIPANTMLSGDVTFEAFASPSLSGRFRARKLLRDRWIRQNKDSRPNSTE